MPQEICDLFYEQAVVDLTEIKPFWNACRLLFYFIFLTMIIGKKEASSSSLSCNPLATQNTDYSLYPQWKRSSHTDSCLDAVDGVKKNYPLKLKTSANWHRSGDLCILNAIRAGVGKWCCFSSVVHRLEGLYVWSPPAGRTLCNVYRSFAIVLVLLICIVNGLFLPVRGAGYLSPFKSHGQWTFEKMFAHAKGAAQ